MEYLYMGQEFGVIEDKISKIVLLNHITKRNVTSEKQYTLQHELSIPPTPTPTPPAFSFSF